MRHQRKKSAPESNQKFVVTTYDSELARLAHERNIAYDTLNDVKDFALSLVDGKYDNIADHLLGIINGDNDD